MLMYMPLMKSYKMEYSSLCSVYRKLNKDVNDTKKEPWSTAQSASVQLNEEVF